MESIRESSDRAPASSAARATASAIIATGSSAVTGSAGFWMNCPAPTSTAWRGSVSLMPSPFPAPPSEAELSHHAQHRRRAGHEHRRDTGRLSALEVVADLRPGTDQGHVLHHRQGDQRLGLVLATRQVELLDLHALLFVAHPGEDLEVEV